MLFRWIRPPAASSRTAEHQHRSHRYEAKRQEIEAWLMRMESRSERMGNAEAQADVLDFAMLDSQQKEQKVRVSARFSSNFTVVRHDFSSAVLYARCFFFARAFGIHESFRSWNIYEPPLLRPFQSSSSRFQNFHAELHTYKHHIELFNQLTQKLIAVYPGDDTTRIKRMTETVNLR